MKKLLIIFVLFVCSATVFADDLRKKAEENPYDLVIYMLSKDMLGSGAYREIFEAERYTDLMKVLDLDEYSRIHHLGAYSVELVKRNKTVEASMFLDRAMQILRDGEEDDWNDETVQYLVKGLVMMHRDKDAEEILSHQEDDENKVKVVIAIASTFLELTNRERAIEVVSTVSPDPDLLDSRTTKDFINLLIDLNQTKAAGEALDKLEAGLTASDDELNRDRNFLRSLSLYIRLGQLKRGFEVWQEHRSISEPHDTLVYARALYENGYVEEAGPFLLELRANKQYMRRDGGDVAAVYLAAGDVDTARNIALGMSTENDNYSQQEALMKTADKLTELGRRGEAIELIETAFKKASKVGEEHDPMASTGASSLSRKTIYLRRIKEAYFKIGLFDKGLATNAVVNTDHWIAKDFRAATTIDYVIRNRSLPVKKASGLVRQALNSCGPEKEDSCKLTAGSAAISAYAIIGEKANAVNIMAGLLEFIDEKGYLNSSIASLAAIFTKNKLSPNARLRKILKKMADHVSYQDELR